MFIYISKNYTEYEDIYSVNGNKMVIKYLFQHYLCFQLGKKMIKGGITTWNLDFGVKV